MLFLLANNKAHLKDYEKKGYPPNSSLEAAGDAKIMAELKCWITGIEKL